MKQRGSMKEIKQLEVNIDTVYIRSNIKKIDTEEFKGWEYDEMQMPLREYLSKLTYSKDSESLALLLSMLMSEIDNLKARITILEGGNK